jgi:phosphotransferase system  glucose/maltose/N-acetylglucosamine-specific IIC component
MWLVIAGWIAAALVFSTFFMRTMVSLRMTAISSNIAFVSYGLLGFAYGVFERVLPILALHACLLPLNVFRLREAARAAAGNFVPPSESLEDVGRETSGSGHVPRPTLREWTR